MYFKDKKLHWKTNFTRNILLSSVYQSNTKHFLKNKINFIDFHLLNIYFNIALNDFNKNLFFQNGMGNISARKG